MCACADELFLIRVTGCLLSEKTSWKVCNDLVQCCYIDFYYYFFAVTVCRIWNVDWCLCFAEVKSRMSLIVSVHVYSVQKAFLRDSGPLYSVDYDAVKDNLQNCSRSQFRAAILTSHERQSHVLTLYVTSCLQLRCHPLFRCGSHVLSGAAASQTGPSSSYTWTRREKA